MTDAEKRINLIDTVQLLIRYSHNNTDVRNQTVQLSAALAMNGDVVAEISANAGNAFFGEWPLAIYVALSTQGLRLGVVTDRICGSIRFPVTTPREPISDVGAFLDGLSGIYLVEELNGQTCAVISDSSLRSFALGRRPVVQRSHSTSIRRLP